MAGVQWAGGKCKSMQQAKAFFRHNDVDRRLEARHSNVHINPKLTDQNFTFFGLDYRGMCEKFNQRLSEIDLGKQRSGKNARTILQSIILYPPKDLPKEKLTEWFTEAGNILVDSYGDNFIEMQVDMDEVHPYIDEETGKLVTSREHGHARLVPEVDGKLNGKKFSSRAHIMELNKKLDDMSYEKFKVRMMDGTKKKRGKTVEELKAASEQAALDAARELSAEAIAQAEREADLIRQSAEEALREREEALEKEYSERLERADQALQEAEKILEEAKQFKADQNLETWMRSKKVKRLSTGEEVSYMSVYERDMAERKAALERKRSAAARDTSDMLGWNAQQGYEYSGMSL